MLPSLSRYPHRLGFALFPLSKGIISSSTVPLVFQIGGAVAICNKTLFAFVLQGGAMLGAHSSSPKCVSFIPFTLVNPLGPMCFHSYVHLLAVNKCSFIFY